MIMVGCNADSKFIVNQGAETVTIIALIESEATIDEAEGVRIIAVNLKEVINNEAKIDPNLIKVFIVSQLIKNIDDPKDRLIYTIMASKITALVLSELDKGNIILDKDIKILVVAASDGIVNGSDIYILSLGPGVASEMEKALIVPEETVVEE